MFFRQPELHGPDGEPIEVPGSLANRLRRQVRTIEIAVRPTIPFPGVTKGLLARLTGISAAIASEALERAFVLSLDGDLVHTTTGSPNKVEVATDLLAHAVLIHNHPEQMPLSIGDLEALFSSRLASVWAVGGPWLYGAAVGPKGAGKTGFAQLKLRSAYLGRVIFAVISSMNQRKELPPGQHPPLEMIHQHVLLCELATEGLIHYVRVRHASRP